MRIATRATATGRTTSLTVHASSGQTPFGFDINDRGQVIVSEAFGGAAGASKVSSYQLDGHLGLATEVMRVDRHHRAALSERGDAAAFTVESEHGLHEEAGQRRETRPVQTVSACPWPPTPLLRGNQR